MTKKLKFLVMGGLTASLVEVIMTIAKKANDSIILEFANSICDANDGVRIYQLGIAYDTEVLVTTNDEDSLNKLEIIFNGGEI